jgi:hypothetical protein
LICCNNSKNEDIEGNEDNQGIRDALYENIAFKIQKHVNEA